MRINNEKYICPVDRTEMEVVEDVIDERTGKVIGVVLFCERCLREYRPKDYYKLDGREIIQGLINPLRD